MAVGWLLGTACPIHHILKELMTVETFLRARHYPDNVYGLCERMGCSTRRSGISTRLAGGSASAGRQLRRRHHLPGSSRNILPPCAAMPKSCTHGKYLMTHTDDENRRLMPSICAGFDIADSVCPHHDPHERRRDIEAFAGRIAIWGGIPSTLLCPDSTGRAIRQTSMHDPTTAIARGSSSESATW